MSISTQSDWTSALLAADPDSAEIRRTQLGGSQSQWVIDSNNLSYAQGSVTFNSQSLVGSTSKRLLDFANAVVMIPVTTVVRTSAGSFGSISGTVASLAPSDAAVVSINPLLALSQVELRLGGQLVHAAQEGFPFLLANRARSFSPEQKRFVLDAYGFDCDDAASQVLDNKVGMINNIPAPPMTAVTGDPSRMGNTGFWNRLRRQSMRAPGYTDLITQPSSTWTVTEKEGLIAVFDDQGAAVGLDATGRYTGGSNRLLQTLVFQTMLKYPMWLISDAFAHLPPMATVTGFSLRLQTAFTQSNSWSVTFTGGAAGAYSKPDSVASSQLDGLVCPYMHAAVCFDGTAVGAARVTANSTITVQGTVGYRSSAPTIVGTRVTSAPERPARIMCNAVLPTPAAWTQWDSQRTATLRYTDFLLDSAMGVAARTSLTKALQHAPSFLRRLTILPVVAAAANRCNGLQSMFDSAPLTCPPVLLDSITLRIAGQQYHLDPLRLPFEKWMRTSLLSNQAYGTSYGDLSSMTGSFSGATFSEWMASPVVQFDLSGCLDEADDAESKSVSVSFTNMSDLGVDIYFIIEFESRLTVDLLNSTAVR